MASPPVDLVDGLATTMLEDVARDLAVALGGSLAGNCAGKQNPFDKQFTLKTSRLSKVLALFASVRCTATYTADGEGDGFVEKRVSSAAPPCWYDTTMG